jgi:AbrB family looped-hinge helix DNA binding protein
MQLISTVTTKGQVLIPVQVRRKLNIKPFDRVEFGVSGAKVVMQKSPGVDEMYGFVKTKGKMTDRQLDEAINQAVKEGVSRDQ